DRLAGGQEGVYFTPDGQFVAFPADPDDDDRSDLYVSPTSGAAPVAVSGGASGAGGLYLFDEQHWFSPDSSHVLFVWNDFDDHTLYAVPVTGGTPIELTRE